MRAETITNKMKQISFQGGGYTEMFFLQKPEFGDGDLDTVVMVKSLLSRTDVHMEECRREIELFSRLNHEHIVRLLGLCKDVEPLFVITEYCEWVQQTSHFYFSTIIFSIAPIFPKSYFLFLSFIHIMVLKAENDKC